MSRDGTSSDDVKTCGHLQPKIGGIRIGARPPDLHENQLLSIWAILRANMQTSRMENKPTAIIEHQPAMTGSGKFKGSKSKKHIE